MELLIMASSVLYRGGCPAKTESRGLRIGGKKQLWLGTWQRRSPASDLPGAEVPPDHLRQRLNRLHQMFRLHLQQRARPCCSVNRPRSPRPCRTRQISPSIGASKMFLVEIPRSEQSSAPPVTGKSSPLRNSCHCLGSSRSELRARPIQCEPPR